jgi:hypothetical protein
MIIPTLWTNSGNRLSLVSYPVPPMHPREKEVGHETRLSHFKLLPYEDSFLLMEAQLEMWYIVWTVHVYYILVRHCLGGFYVI